jgi:hypothetical protein
VIELRAIRMKVMVCGDERDVDEKRKFDIEGKVGA